MTEWFKTGDLLKVTQANENLSWPKSGTGLHEYAQRRRWKREDGQGPGRKKYTYLLTDLKPEELVALLKFKKSIVESALPAAAKAKSNGGDRPAIVADARSDLPVDAAAGTSEQASELDIEEAKRRWLAADEQHKEIARTAMRGCVMVDEIVNENLRKGYPAGIMTAYKKTAHAIGRSKDSVRRDYGRAMRFPSEYRVMALTPGWNLQERSSQIKRDPELSRAIVQKIIYAPNSPHTEIPQVLRALGREFPNRELPSEPQVRRFLNRWKVKNKALFVGLTNPRRFANEFLTAIGDASAGIVRPNQQLQTDFTAADMDLLDGVFSLGAMHDVFTHRTMSRLSRHPSGDEQAMLIVEWMLRYGVIETLKSDRGREILNERIQRGLMDVGTLLEICNAYSGWEKAYIERGHQGYHRRFVELPGYHGRNVAVRQELRDRMSRAQRRGLTEREILHVALTSDQMRVELARIDRELNDTPLDALGGLSPNRFAAQHAGPMRPSSYDEAILYLMFAPGAERIVGKEGIAYENVDFWHRKLIPLIKQPVFVAETHDGRLAVYTADRKKFICVAENPERVGKDRREMAILARQAQARFVVEGRKAIGGACKKITAQVVASALDEVNANARTTPVSSLRLVHDTAAPERAAVSLASRALEDAAAGLSQSLAGPPMYNLDDLSEQNWRRYTKLTNKPSSAWSEEDGLFMRVYSNTPACRLRLEELRERSA
jgi:Mu transposase-like protein